MKNNFNAEFFTANRRKLQTLFTGKAPIVVTASGLLQQAGDTTFPFRQDANFWYLTGIDEPDIILVIDKDKEYLIVPDRSNAKKAFDGEVDFSELTHRSGVEKVYEEKQGWKQLSSKLDRAKHLATLAAPVPYFETFGFYTNPARSTLLNKIKSINPSLELLDLRQHMAVMRMVKQRPELDAIQEAIDITAKSLAGIKQKLTTFSNEFEIEATLSYDFRMAGAAGHAFDPIVASGKRACQIHPTDNNSPLGSNELLVLDVGAEVNHYAADITRTFALGKISKRQQQVFNAVKEVQEYAFGLLKPGIVIRDYEQQIEQIMGEKLRELGLIKTIEHDQVRHYYPHATSHFMGIDVHDAGDYDRPLEPGVVLTVEPGIYIPEEGIGVRIEDDVIVTEKGIRILSEGIAREL